MSFQTVTKSSNLRDSFCSKSMTTCSIKFLTSSENPPIKSGSWEDVPNRDIGWNSIAIALFVYKNKHLVISNDLKFGILVFIVISQYKIINCAFHNVIKIHEIWVYYRPKLWINLGLYCSKTIFYTRLIFKQVKVRQIRNKKPEVLMLLLLRLNFFINSK